MEYLYRQKKKRVAHIWIDEAEDTACRMWSTGGLLQGRGDWQWCDSKPERRICKTCVAAFQNGRSVKIDKLLQRKANETLGLTAHGKTKKSHNKKEGVDPRSNEFLASWEWRTLRYKVLQRYDRRCMCCGASPDDGQTVIHVDHIKPRHTHPELALDASNLQVLCGVCNQGKGSWDKTDFREGCTEYEQHIDNVVQIEIARKASESQ